MKTDGGIKEAMDVSREPKSVILCESLTQRTNVSRVSFKISGDKEAVMLAEMREKALMDEQSRLNGARKEGMDIGRKDGLKETIMDNLSELGNVPQNLINLINEQNNMDVLKSWTKIAVMAKSLEEFEEKIES